MHLARYQLHHFVSATLCKVKLETTQVSHILTIAVSEEVVSAFTIVPKHGASSRVITRREGFKG